MRDYTSDGSVGCDKDITKCGGSKIVELHHGSSFGVFLWVFAGSLDFFGGEEIS